MSNMSSQNLKEQGNILFTRTFNLLNRTRRVSYCFTQLVRYAMYIFYAIIFKKIIILIIDFIIIQNKIEFYSRPLFSV